MRASFLNRLIAWIIDTFIILFVAFTVRDMVYGSINFDGNFNTPLDTIYYFFSIKEQMNESIPLMLGVAVLFNVFIAKFVFKDQSIGKKIRRLKISRKDGEKVKMVQIAARSLFQSPILLYITWYLASFNKSPLVFIVFMGSSMFLYLVYLVASGIMAYGRIDTLVLHDMLFQTTVVVSSSSKEDIVWHSKYIDRLNKEISFYELKEHQDDENELKITKYSNFIVRGFKENVIVRGPVSYYNKDGIDHVIKRGHPNKELYKLVRKGDKMPINKEENTAT